MLDISIPHIIGGSSILMALSFVLYGTTIVQFFTYWLNCSKDSYLLKGMVVALFVLETAGAAFAIADIYHIVITSFDNPLLLLFVTRSPAFIVMLEHLTVLIVQSFYIHRIWISKFMAGNIHDQPLLRSTCIFSNFSNLCTQSILLAIRFAFGLAATAYLFRFTIWTQFHSRGPEVAVNGDDVVSALLDAVVASAMIYYLSKRRSAVSTSTNGVVRWILAYSINTGAMSFIVALGAVISYTTMPDSLLFAGFFVLLGRLYVNSFLGTLNARPMLQARMVGNEAVVDDSFELGDVSHLRA
ncbi:hypothetical protein K474DRAFT_1710362 [Panus rudis PR-1116 ss-1]|nr:hypothetical protein K474DRAFT_1710362 [Panus rudis PR-1116 ss-1]